MSENVQGMSTEMARLSTTLENQVKTTDTYKVSLESLLAKINAIELEQAKRANRVYEVKEIQSDVKRIDSLIVDLQKKGSFDQSSNSETIDQLRKRVHTVEVELQARTKNVYEIPSILKRLEVVESK